MIAMRPKLHQNCCSKFDKAELKGYIRRIREELEQLNGKQFNEENEEKEEEPEEVKVEEESNAEIKLE